MSAALFLAACGAPTSEAPAVVDSTTVCIDSAKVTPASIPAVETVTTGSTGSTGSTGK